jgi:hypothetical protein
MGHMPNSRAEHGEVGCGWFLALWFGSEILATVLMATVGPEGFAWIIAIGALISVAFVMVYGSFRVLRGKEL